MTPTAITNAPAAARAPMLERFADVLADPVAGGPLIVSGDALVSQRTGQRFEIAQGIPRLYAEVDPATGAAVNEISDRVKSFYEETPFPNYDQVDSRYSLQRKAAAGVFARMLDEELPQGSLVWEAGCGTGQLSNFLGLSWRRHVFAFDLCVNSLGLARDFADRNMIRNVSFIQGNLFCPPFRDEAFDVVISNGVLHHTADCEGAFRSILTKLKPGGHILVGLYNYYGRLPTLWKRRAFARFGAGLHFLDPRLGRLQGNQGRLQAWFKDQYQHPHETRHSMDEVLGWFDRYGVDFVNGVPHVDGTEFSSREKLFEPRTRGNAISRVSAQLNMLMTGGQDGGLFIMIGRKRSGAAPPG